MLLEKYSKAARAAYSGTSHSPEKRGDTIIESYSEELMADLKELKDLNIDQDIIDQYQKRYETYFTAWLSACSRVVSPMIAGPSNFPVRQMTKIRRSEDNRFAAFREFRTKAKAGIIRRSKPKETYVSESDKVLKEIANLEKLQESMKAVNKIIQKAKGADCSQAIYDHWQSIGFTRMTLEQAASLLKPDFAGRIGFPSYKLTNNSAMIRNKKLRVQDLLKKEKVREEIEQGKEGVANEYNFKGGKVVLNYEENRIQIIYDAKPDEEIRKELKALNCNWSPTNGAWQRFITNNSIHAINNYLDLKIPFI